MPKMKTHKGAAKRFKKTASGKVKRGHSHWRHILTSKAHKRKRKLGKSVLVTGASRGIGRALRETADLVGDNGETGARFARARRFDRRIQRQNVRLKREIVHDLGYARDARRRRVRLADRRQHRLEAGPDLGDETD